jgi:phenylacetate-CoA ligase
MAGVLEQVYARSPLWLQQVGMTAYGAMWKRRRFGKWFREAVPRFALRDSFSELEWEEYQTRELRRLLRSAGETVPYYRDRFHCAGISSQDLVHFHPRDLIRLPILEKDDIRDDPMSIVSEAARNLKLHTYKTSGTTGTPMEIKFSTQIHQLWSAAYEVRCRHWAGVNNGMSRAMIGGRLVVPDANASPPFWRYNAAERQLYMSAFHISPANARHYAEALSRFKPDYLVGYASAHFFLARLFDELRLQVHSPKAVLTSSEKLTEEMRDLIERVYRCKVFDAYSGVEACCLASECEHHRLHVSPDVGIIELLGDDGRPVRAGEVGEIVATGLLNDVQPLVRYRTGDYAILSTERCPCGRQMPILQELVGRLEDTVVGKDGREMVRFHGIFVGLPNIREGQVVQDDYTRFRLRLAVTSSFGEGDRSTIRKRFKERLGDVELSFEYVDRVERTARGKYRAVVSHVRRKSQPIHGLAVAAELENT